MNQNKDLTEDILEALDDKINIVYSKAKTIHQLKEELWKLESSSKVIIKAKIVVKKELIKELENCDNFLSTNFIARVGNGSLKRRFGKDAVGMFWGHVLVLR